jgi:shikimate dehydrogenase
MRKIPITGHTELIGLIATPIRHSMSPAMHNAAFEKLGMDRVYLVFEVGKEGLEATVNGLRAMGVRGWNVSMPNKTAIIPYLDKITPAAEMCGAVNTVINDNGVLTGTITDGTGWVQSVREQGVDLTGKKMTLLGAGGAGRPGGNLGFQPEGRLLVAGRGKDRNGSGKDRLQGQPVLAGRQRGAAGGDRFVRSAGQRDRRRHEAA